MHTYEHTRIYPWYEKIYILCCNDYLCLWRYLNIWEWINTVTKQTKIEIYWIELLNDNPIFLPTRGFIRDLGEYTTQQVWYVEYYNDGLQLRSYIWIHNISKFFYCSPDTLFRMKWSMNGLLIENISKHYSLIEAKPIFKISKFN